MGLNISLLMPGIKNVLQESSSSRVGRFIQMLVSISELPSSAHPMFVVRVSAPLLSGLFGVSFSLIRENRFKTILISIIIR